MPGALAACGAMGTSTYASVVISDRSVSRSSSDGSSITASWRIVNDGTILANGSVVETWLANAADVGLYEVRATLSSGTTPTGTLNTWLPCSTSRSWVVTDSTDNGSAVTCLLFVELRLASSGVVQDSAWITLTANCRLVTP